MDDRLGKLAKTWLTSSDVHDRVQGVKALEHFRSAATIKLLKQRLADPGVYMQSSQDASGTIRREKLYPVREAAYKVLSTWRIKVRRPVIRQPVP